MKRPVSPDNKRDPRAKNQAKPTPLAFTATRHAVSVVGSPLMRIPTPKTMSALAIQTRRKSPALPASGKPVPAEPIHPRGDLPPQGTSSGTASCALGSSGSRGCVDPNPRPHYTHPLAALRPPVSGRKPSRRSKCATAADSTVACDLFLAVLAFLGDESKLYCSLSVSIHRSVRIQRILQACAAETAIRYLSAFQRFASTCESLHYSLIQLEEVDMADILITLSLERHEDFSAGSCSITTIKALRWVCRNTETDCLSKAYGPLLSSFLSRKLPKDRKEAVPLPLFALVHFERRILSSSASIGEILILEPFWRLLGPHCALQIANA